ncbi:LysM peptidoglycan-binding domain-containing protein [Spirosoma sp. BT702]|uniref:LysM peptidoglycan-binding domain-containing protein n=1 Tax=Spirosoma profusum TaxID=2771354 RepID=A0A926XXF8_9BACT|nr:LysM peptidoglycan-binding domain-containing protein [Spirosoma profusum]MBD2701821.1 LysM peptidoglycan-binding domain-containing protein [Spirosoma profusum]
MKKNFAYTVFCLVTGLIFLHHTQAHPLLTYRNTFDSVGVEKKDGKRFILHRVDEGQTLFAISRKYKRSVAEIKAANPNLKDAVKYDQLIRIPVPDGALSRKEEKAMDKAIRKQEKEEKKAAKAATKSEDKKNQKSEALDQSGIHVVEARQTLYSLANRYGVSQADIRKWNNLSGNNVLIGQALIVSEKAYLDLTPASQVAAANNAKPAKKSTTNTPTTTSPPAQRPAEQRSSKPRRDTRDTAITSRPTAPNSQTASDKPAEEIEKPSPGNDAPMPTQGRRISDSGVAEMISSNDHSNKFLALHRSAPVGALVNVRNEFNNQSLWVKVIGRLPNTGVNDKILIKLSTQAFAKLSPEDKRFRAEVSYMVR